MRIALIACCKKKQGAENPNFKYKAKDIYLGNSFNKAKSIGVKKYGCDDYFIISAKHYLLDKDDEISYYDKTLNKMSIKERKQWVGIVLKQLESKFNLKDDEFYIFGGGKYYQFLIPHLNCAVFEYENSNSILLDKPTFYRNGGK